MTRGLLCLCFFSFALLVLEARQKPREIKGPESFSANFNVATGVGAAAGTAEIRIDKYTPDDDREAVAAALKNGGHEAFMTALRKAPAVGSLTVAGKAATIRWARQQRTGATKRTITVVTDEPVLFVGGGLADAKPRDGYEVAAVKFEIDDGGYTLNPGTMAAAARMKVDSSGNVEVADYSTAPIKLISITKKGS